MPEINQITLKHDELVKLIIKNSDIHEGRWWLLIGFGMAPGNFGPSEDQVSPGIVVAVNSVGIQRELPGTPAPTGLVVDAAIVNPLPHSAKTAPKRKGSGV